MRVQYLVIFTLLIGGPVAANEQRPGTEAEAFAAKIAWQQEQEPAAYGAARRDLIRAWSSDDSNALDEIISADLDGRDKTIGFLGFIKADHGPIRDLQFKYFDTLMQRQNPRRLAVYHAVFDDGSWWALRLGLDSDGRIDRIILTDPNYNEVLPVQRSRQLFELPFAAGEQWYVLWGGRTESMNYHVTSRSQRNALDLLVLHPYSNQSYRGRGETNDNYYAFGRAVLAPVTGTVVNIIDDVDDNEPGTMDRENLTGNTVVIKTVDDEYLLLAHLKKGSVTVRVGDSVEVGDNIGRVGNSGNSSEPHLHMQLMSGPDMKSAMGIEIRFRALVVRGDSVVKNYSPVRADIVERITKHAGRLLID